MTRANPSLFSSGQPDAVLVLTGLGKLVNGRRGPPPCTFSKLCGVAVAPMPIQTVLILAEGERTTEGIELYTNTPIPAGQEGRDQVDSAMVQYGGKTYRVRDVKEWPQAQAFVIQALRVASPQTEGLVLFGAGLHSSTASGLAAALTRALAPSRNAIVPVTTSTGQSAYVGLSRVLSGPTGAPSFLVDGEPVTANTTVKNTTIGGEVIDLYELAVSAGDHVIEVLL